MAGFLPSAAVAISVLIAAGVAIESGLITVPLPFPADGKIIHEAAPGSLPPRSDPHFKANNTALTAATKPFKGVKGVETIALAPDGSLTLIDSWGQVFRAASNSSGDYTLDPSNRIASLGTGRFLGASYDQEGNLYVCNAPFGLLRVEHLGEPDKQRIELVASGTSKAAGGAVTPILLADDLDIASDGTVYFTDATNIPTYRTTDGSWDAEGPSLLALSQGKPFGRLLAYHPSNRTTTVLADGFWFANGLALSQDESFAAVTDVLQMRVMRVWLKGPKAGSQDVLIDKLPALPDNIARAPDGAFWLAFVSATPGLVKHSQPKLVRALMAYAPKALRPKPAPVGLVMKVGADGRVLLTLSDPKGSVVRSTTHVLEHNERLFLGNLHDEIAVLKWDNAVAASH